PPVAPRPARTAPSAAPATPAGGTPATGDAETVRILVRQLLERMGIRADVSAHEIGESIQVDISGRDLGMLIGWRGETLRALQTMTNLLASRHMGAERRVVVDVEKYRQRRENTVREIAERAAMQVKVTGDPITLDAMQPFERRAIHLALQDDPAVTTGSIGEEPDRRVVVSPAAREDA
ncbi:MAG: KH domain-containing protein, partial [Candidatus Dormibacteraeota bacterium]|nr:KH domain-containing protein [Candidatus Dormibacteraeota bacterium]